MNSFDTSTLGWSPGLLGAYITCGMTRLVFNYLKPDGDTFLIASLTEFLLWGLSSTVSPT